MSRALRRKVKQGREEILERVRGKTLALCLPQTDQVTAQYALSLSAMSLRLGMSPCAERVVTVAHSSSLLPNSREEIAREAIGRFQATHLLWIDADHRFPPDTAHRLMAHGRPYVGINATTRRGLIRYTALRGPGDLLETRADTKGIEPVWRMGFGIVLIEARVFKAMDPPWFGIEWVQGKDSPICRGEDIYFCEKAKAAGFTPHVDHDLSKETAHVGAVEWTCTDVPEEIIQ